MKKSEMKEPKIHVFHNVIPDKESLYNSIYKTTVGYQ